mmetsp:Transcript_67785/g.113830  ORF Transcript_67785/g.113830 Transcript_67785/m.113830 type:complete len:141 (+) Transcript_67785:242-664(+)
MLMGDQCILLAMYEQQRRSRLLDIYFTVPPVGNTHTGGHACTILYSITKRQEWALEDKASHAQFELGLCACCQADCNPRSNRIPPQENSAQRDFHLEVQPIKSGLSSSIDATFIWLPTGQPIAGVFYGQDIDINIPSKGS